MSEADVLFPALFIGHGSPMNALERNSYTMAWRRIGQALPRPRAVLVISAHWYVGVTAVTAMPDPRTIHDFYGFPQALFDFQYPAPGLPGLAAEVAEAVWPHWVGDDLDQWGIDHGSWSVLTHLFPDADVPVVQLSINATKPMEYHVDLGRRLASLRERGVLILASGSIVHNLHRIRWSEPEAGDPWARRFDDHVQEVMHDDPGGILKVLEHPDYAISVPTPEHFVPLLYLAGLASVAKDPLHTLVKGYSMGSLSMTCYGIGQDLPLSGEEIAAGVLAEATSH